ncbi:MAG TPA: NAD(P)/FAD-dependent oxidoreductase [Bryobacteraceae bacterium]
MNKTAYVIGSGPNGLTAGIQLARAGLHVTVLEGQSTMGGGLRTLPLTLPGFLHDICSAAHPMAVSSPIFRELPLQDHGLRWIHARAPLAHPFDDGTAAVLEQSLDSNSTRLGVDGPSWRRVVKPLVEQWDRLAGEIFRPLHFPAHPYLFSRFGVLAPWPATWTSRSLFKTAAARALFAGVAAHAIMPLEHPFSSAIAWPLVIAAHAVGWPIAQGGSQSIANALASYLQSLGGTIVLNSPVRSLDEFEPDSLILCDVTPRQLLRIAGDRLPPSYRRRLEKYRYGPGVFKLDWALKTPIPWKSADCARAATVHLGGTLEEIADSERAAWRGELHDRPYVLLVQPSLFDTTRAPQGMHTAWAYCHVPHASTADCCDRIEQQVERFAPGFRSTVLARSKMTPGDLEQHNANLIGGDISGGQQGFPQLFARPTVSLYRTPVKQLYLCSSSTPPGAGIHGMCGYNAAHLALSERR